MNYILYQLSGLKSDNHQDSKIKQNWSNFFDFLAYLKLICSYRFSFLFSTCFNWSVTFLVGCHIKCHKDHVDIEEIVITPCKGTRLSSCRFLFSLNLSAFHSFTITFIQYFKSSLLHSTITSCLYYCILSSVYWFNISHAHCSAQPLLQKLIISFFHFFMSSMLPQYSVGSFINYFIRAITHGFICYLPHLFFCVLSFIHSFII